MTVMQQYHGMFEVGAGNDAFAVGGTSLQVTHGLYFLRASSGESTRQLCEEVQHQIRTGTAYTSATVTYDATTERVTIALGSTATLAWTDAALGVALGFTSGGSGQSTYVGQRKPRYVWAPSRTMSSVDTSPEAMFAAVSTAMCYRAHDGCVTSVDGTVLYDAMGVSYVGLPRADVLRASSPDYRSWEEFFEDVIAHGRPMRVYPDRTSDAYHMAMWANGSGEALRETIARTISSYMGYWDVSLRLWRIPPGCDVSGVS